jgi:hypothetical protein
MFSFIYRPVLSIRTIPFVFGSPIRRCSGGSSESSLKIILKTLSECEKDLGYPFDMNIGAYWSDAKSFKENFQLLKDGKQSFKDQIETFRNEIQAFPTNLQLYESTFQQFNVEIEDRLTVIENETIEKLCGIRKELQKTVHSVTSKQAQEEDGKRTSGCSTSPTKLTLVKCSFDERRGAIAGLVLMKLHPMRKYPEKE